MKYLKLVVFSLSVLFSSLSHADIFFFTSAKDNCETLPGHWTGEGSISAAGGFISCQYTGTADVAPSLDIYSFSMDVTLKKESGLICPSNESFKLAGRCDNGVITIQNDPAHLSGNLNEAGTEASLTGTITLKTPPVTVTVDYMNLHKS